MAESTTPSKHPSFTSTEPNSVPKTGMEEKKEEREEEEDAVDRTVHRLASRISRHTVASDATKPYNNISHPLPDSELDPRSSNFNTRAWVEALVQYEGDNVESGRRSKSGVSFRNLDVYGFGMSTDYQKSVGNIILSLTMQRHKRRTNILHGFEGLVDTSEMLLVLGPPGSGCSTLLRTIAGQMEGLFLGDDATLNYRGMYGSV